MWKERHQRRKSSVNCLNLIESKSVAGVLNWVQLRIGKFKFHIWDCCQCHTATNKNYFRKLIKKVFPRPKAAIWMNRFVNELKDKEKIDCFAETLYCLHWKKKLLERRKWIFRRSSAKKKRICISWVRVTIECVFVAANKRNIKCSFCVMNHEALPSRFNIFPQSKPPKTKNRLGRGWRWARRFWVCDREKNKRIP